MTGDGDNARIGDITFGDGNDYGHGDGDGAVSQAFLGEGFDTGDGWRNGGGIGTGSTCLDLVDHYDFRTVIIQAQVKV